MRMIGHLSDEGKARTFGDFLYVQGIENQIEAEKDGSWVVWIHSEEELERAKGLLAEFQQNPADPKFKNTGQADDMRRQKEKEQKRYEKRMKEGQQLFRQRTYYGVGPVTVVLMCVSVAVFLISKFGTDVRPELPLFITVTPSPYGFHGLIELGNRIMHLNDYLPEIFQGQVWRLFTPMFIHMNFLHIFFNMLWLWDLGGMIEARQNSWFLAVMVLIVAIISNLAQFLINGPAFGGMSGVTYGLFGYIWIRAKFDPWCGLYLHPTTVAVMIIWFFVCLIGIMGPVANTCHAAGLLVGMAWGYLASLRRRH